jgi:hypothetical protein
MQQGIRHAVQVVAVVVQAQLKGTTLEQRAVRQQQRRARGQTLVVAEGAVRRAQILQKVLAIHKGDARVEARDGLA